MPTYRARSFDRCASLALTIEGGRITRLGESDSAADGILAPAFCDIQINGCLGISFNAPTLTPAEVRRVVDKCRAHGIVQFLATLITGPREAIRHGCSVIAQACRTDPVCASSIVGLHLEGPYISPRDGARGAHPREFVREPNEAEFQDWQTAAEGRIRLLTVAPEVPGVCEFIRRRAHEGLVIALGHTAATSQEIRSAVDAGASLSTHLGNGCSSMLPRHDNVIWHQLAEDRLWASLITDEVHLPPSVMKALIRGKTSERILLTSDAGPLAGLPPGRYPVWNGEYEVAADPLRIIVPGTPYLAGSAVFTDACLRGVLRHGAVTLAEAIGMVSVRPRTLLGLPHPRLEVGAPADFVLLSDELGSQCVPLFVG